MNFLCRMKSILFRLLLSKMHTNAHPIPGGGAQDFQKMAKMARRAPPTPGWVRGWVGARPKAGGLRENGLWVGRKNVKNVRKILGFEDEMDGEMIEIWMGM